jgi:hypothetical protein
MSSIEDVGLLNAIFSSELAGFGWQAPQRASRCCRGNLTRTVAAASYLKKSRQIGGFKS